ncbi:DUF2059 domain-containing protein [Oceanicaulis sp. LC35]|uniref:DUF2059 domain-containing protein n=1 Tax=Oceanicaulis sp. LC35 TaxID=3349635 RepID=UPI003F834E70
MIRLVLAASAAVFLAAPSLAQSDDDVRLAEAERMMELTGSSDATSMMMGMMMPTMEPVLRSQFAAASDAQISEALALIEQTMTDLVPQIVSEGASAYAAAFTLEELEEINAFYETETGQKLVVSMPQLMQEVALVSEQMGIEAMQGIQPQIEAIMAQ